jgi:hypothetical protein
VDVKELRERCQSLLVENKALREENEILKARLGMTAPPRPIPLRVQEKSLPLVLVPPAPPIISFQSDPAEKIRLFMSLFKGREDVYAKRWQNRQGRAGYATVCRNEWKAGLCRKAAIKCLDCHISLMILNDKVIEAHLRGNIVAGLYPLCRDETCHLLAIDFDDEDGKRTAPSLGRSAAPSAFPWLWSVPVPETGRMRGFSLPNRSRQAWREDSVPPC